MPSAQDYIYNALIKEYMKAVNPIMTPLIKGVRSPESRLQKALTEFTAYMVGAPGIKWTDSDSLKEVMGEVEEMYLMSQGLISQYAADVAASGAGVANRAVTAKMFAPTTQELLNAGLDPISSQAYSLFQEKFLTKKIRYRMPEANELARALTNTDAFKERMDNWGKGYDRLFKLKIEQALVQGWGPKKTASAIREFASNMPVSAVENYTRTLQLQAYRDQSARIENQMGEFVQKKIRIAALDQRTCPACIALHGTELPVGEAIRDHYRGRCDAIYVMKGQEMPEMMQAMSEPGKRQFVPWQTGDEWFATLPKEQQKSILGPGKFDWYKKEKSLQGLVGSYPDSIFGDMPVVKPLWELQGYQSHTERMVDVYGEKEQEDTRSSYEKAYLPDYGGYSGPRLGEGDFNYYNNEFLEEMDDLRFEKVNMERWGDYTSVDELPDEWDLDQKTRWFTLDDEEKASEIEQWISEKFDGDRVRVCHRTDALEQLLIDGRSKSQFETGYSMGTYDPDFRKDAELRGLGFPHFKDPTLRPAYGTVQGTGNTGASYYGHFELVFKKEAIKNRTTVTFGDSLGPFAAGEQIGSPLTRVNGASADDYWGIVQKGKQIDAPGGIKWGYIEVQIHGGFTMDDVDHINVEDSYLAAYQNGKQLLEDHGYDDIEIRLISNDDWN